MDRADRANEADLAGRASDAARAAGAEATRAAGAEVADLREKHGRELSREELVREAKLQTDAIQRLNVWLRLGYSLVAVGFILGLWGMQGGPAWAVPAGVACLVLGVPLAAVLKVGTTRAKRNVKTMMEAAGIDLDEGAR